MIASKNCAYRLSCRRWSVRSLGTVSTSLIKELRSRSGAPITAVKEALVAESGDIDAALDHLRRMGAKVASERADRSTAEGLIGLHRDSSRGVVSMVELKCETDFVSRTAVFHNLLGSLLSSVQSLESKWSRAAEPLDIDQEDILKTGNNNDKLSEAAAALGETLRVGKITLVKGKHIGAYVHGAVPKPSEVNCDFKTGRIGVAVALDGGDGNCTKIADQLAMHVAAEAPLYLRRELVPENVLAKERNLLTDLSVAESTKSNSKPLRPEILQKKVEGRLNKWLGEVVLEEQIMLLESADTTARGKAPTVLAWLMKEQPGCEIASFRRLAVS